MPASPLAAVAGVYNAASFAYGVNPAIAPGRVSIGNTATTGSSSLTAYVYNIALPDGTAAAVFNTNASILVDVGSNQETLTPSAVTQNSDGTVTITCAFTILHGRGCLLASGTAGLQEALNAASSAGGGTVVTGGDWASLGGTTAEIQAATVASSCALIDRRGASAALQIASGTADAVNLNGITVMVTGSAVDAMTLATPVSGTNDGLQVNVICQSAHAHTITAASNKINGTDKTVTFAGAVGDFVTLTAYKGVWYMTASLGVTLS